MTKPYTRAEEERLARIWDTPVTYTEAPYGLPQEFDVPLPMTWADLVAIAHKARLKPNP